MAIAFHWQQVFPVFGMCPVVWKVADPALCQDCAEIELTLVHW